PYQQPIEGNIETRDLCFRYAEGEPFVLRNVNLSIRSGDYVAITGPSGCGKTTLQGARADSRDHCAPARDDCTGQRRLPRPRAGWCCATVSCTNCGRVCWQRKGNLAARAIRLASRRRTRRMVLRSQHLSAILSTTKAHAS